MSFETQDKLALPMSERPSDSEDAWLLEDVNKLHSFPDDREGMETTLF